MICPHFIDEKAVIATCFCGWLLIKYYYYMADPDVLRCRKCPPSPAQVTRSGVVPDSVTPV